MVAAWLALAAPAQALPRFAGCGPFGFECTRVSVPLDRSGAVPGRVSLFVKRVRARERPRRGALVVLAGGPGQSATDAFGGSALSVLHPAYQLLYILEIADRHGLDPVEVARVHFQLGERLGLPMLVGKIEPSAM